MDLAPAQTSKSTTSCLNQQSITVLEWPANYPDLDSTEDLESSVMKRMTDRRFKKADELPKLVEFLSFLTFNFSVL